MTIKKVAEYKQLREAMYLLLESGEAHTADAEAIWDRMDILWERHLTTAEKKELQNA